MGRSYTSGIFCAHHTSPFNQIFEDINSRVKKLIVLYEIPRHIHIITSHAKIFIDYLASCQLYSQSVICISVAFWTLCLKRRNYASRRVGPWSVDTMIYCFYTMYIRRSKLLLLFTSFDDTLARNQAMHSGDTRTDISRITRMHEEMFILRLR